MANIDLVGSITKFVITECERSTGKKFHDLKESIQREMALAIQTNAKKFVRDLVNVVAADDRATLVAECDSVTTNGEKLRASLSMAPDDPMRHALVDAAGKSILIVVTDVESYTKTDSEVEIEPDQKDIEREVKRQKTDADTNPFDGDTEGKPRRGRRRAEPEPEPEPEPEDDGEANDGDDEDGFGGDDDQSDEGEESDDEDEDEDEDGDEDEGDGEDEEDGEDGEEDDDGSEDGENGDTGGGWSEDEDGGDESVADELAREETEAAAPKRRRRVVADDAPPVETVASRRKPRHAAAPEPAPKRQDVTPIPKTSSRPQAKIAKQPVQRREPTATKPSSGRGAGHPMKKADTKTVTSPKRRR